MNEEPLEVQVEDEEDEGAPTPAPSTPNRRKRRKRARLDRYVFDLGKRHSEFTEKRDRARAARTKARKHRQRC